MSWFVRTPKKCHAAEATERFQVAVLNLLGLLRNQGVSLMSAISDFSTAVNAHFDRQDVAVADLQGDVQSLNDQIAALNASPGTITASDQTLLDAIAARAAGISAKLDALDALTPPVAPPVVV
jgi:hypothetical protein